MFGWWEMRGLGGEEPDQVEGSGGRLDCGLSRVRFVSWQTLPGSEGTSRKEESGGDELALLPNLESLLASLLLFFTPSLARLAKVIHHKSWADSFSHGSRHVLLLHQEYG